LNAIRMSASDSANRPDRSPCSSQDFDHWFGEFGAFGFENRPFGPARAEEKDAIPNLHGCVGILSLYAQPGRHGIVQTNQKGNHVQVLVRDNNIDQALRVLKKKMQREGVFREMKLRKHYEKPSERKTREKADAIRRARKLARKKLQREGLLPMKPRVAPGTVGSGRPSRAPRF
jgi:small subunit ribosomal protein S21